MYGNLIFGSLARGLGGGQFKGLVFAEMEESNYTR